VEDQDGSELVMALRVLCPCDLMRGVGQQPAEQQVSPPRREKRRLGSNDGSWAVWRRGSCSLLSERLLPL
jgi:hypothetical protein